MIDRDKISAAIGALPEMEQRDFRSVLDQMHVPQISDERAQYELEQAREVFSIEQAKGRRYVETYVMEWAASRFKFKRFTQDYTALNSLCVRPWLPHKEREVYYEIAARHLNTINVKGVRAS